MKIEKISDSLFLFKDLCNVYVLKENEEGISVDFGSGNFMKYLNKIGVKKITDVFITHPHFDHICGLEKENSFRTHAPAGSEKFISPEGIEKYWDFLKKLVHGCPPNYSPIRKGIKNVLYDICEGNDIFWKNKRIRFIPTPGHTEFAYSILMDIDGKQIVFCGDAFYSNSKIFQPYHLEWDHWTGKGVLSAWEGIIKLKNIKIDVLCPGHGEVLKEDIKKHLEKLGKKLLYLYFSKGSICPGEKDRYFQVEIVDEKIKKVIPSVYHFGENGYLIVSKNKECIIIDPFSSDMVYLEKILKKFNFKPVIATSTHYHLDHIDGIDYLRKKYKTKLLLHPLVAEPLKIKKNERFPWLPLKEIKFDSLLPEHFKWNEYEFEIFHFPGQTWWSCGIFMTVDGFKALFSGDNFQPPSRWNGTGGFCAYNRSRFKEGFYKSAEKVIKLKPDLILAGHGTFYYFNRTYFEKVKKWAIKTEKIILSLCPDGDIENNYYKIKYL